MARLVVHTATGPKKVEASKEDQYMCMCGLSKNKPFCDGSHKNIKSEKEDELKAYDEDGVGLSFESEDHSHESGCCGGDCEDKKKKKESCCGDGECC